MNAFLQALLKRLLTREKREHFKMMAMLLLRAGGLLICMAVALMFGAVPFVIGAGAQLLTRRRVSNYLIGLIAAVAVFGLWWTTKWVQINFGPTAPKWVAVSVAMYLGGSVFAPLGAHVVRFFVQRQFLPKA